MQLPSNKLDTATLEVGCKEIHTSGNTQQSFARMCGRPVQSVAKAEFSNSNLEFTSCTYKHPTYSPQPPYAIEILQVDVGSSGKDPSVVNNTIQVLRTTSTLTVGTPMHVARCSSTTKQNKTKQSTKKTKQIITITTGTM